MTALSSSDLLHLDNPRVRALVTGQDGSGKSQAAQDYADAHGGIYMPCAPYAHMSGLATTVADEIALGLERRVGSVNELTVAVQALAADLGIEELLDADPLKLSGGQTQLVALAGLLSLGAPALAIDEPLRGLDQRMQERVLKTLCAYKGPVLWVSVRPTARERESASHVLDLGQEKNNYQPLALQLPARQPITLSAQELGVSPLIPVRRRRRTKQTAPPLQQNLSLQLKSGETLLVSGANGSGKSTLLRTLAGLQTPASGVVLAGEKEPATLPAPRRVRYVQLVAQSPAHHFLSSTVAEELKLGAGADSSQQVREGLLTAIGLRGQENIHPLDLLPAQQRLLTVASALAGATPCLLLDEPTEQLDDHGLQCLINLLQAHLGAGGSLVIATHDPALNTALHGTHLHLTSTSKMRSPTQSAMLDRHPPP